MIGKWNKSVILSYMGLLSTTIGIYLVFNNKISYAFACLVISGICDMFDGTIARKCKRTEEEIEFGIQLDSLIDTYSFGAFPVIIFYGMGLTEPYHIIIYFIYGMFAVARLANFNLSATNTLKKYYTGLPVTSSSIIFPGFYLLSRILNTNTFNIIYTLVILIVAVLFVLKIKVIKPKGKALIFLGLLGIIGTIILVI